MATLGSYSVPKQLSQDASLRQPEKLLLTVMASESRPDRPADHTHRQLAHRLGCSRTSVARWIDHLVEKGYLRRERYRPPLARWKPRCCYRLPHRVWRLFMRAWAMVGPRWRKLAKDVHDYLEPRLPLFFLETAMQIPASPGKRKRILQDSNIYMRPVRGPQSAPDHSEQLSFAELSQVSSAAGVLAGFRRGLEFLSPQQRERVLAQVAP